jgi:polar amino acid transport system substrate-binding protein
MPDAQDPTSGFGWALVVVLTLVGVIFASTAGADAGLEAVRQRGVLRWGGDMQGGEPYVFQDSTNSQRLLGFEVEIADALARHLGVHAEFVQNDWSTLIPSLERGDFDVAMNGIEVTPSRRARVAFTQPYYSFTETLVVRADSTLVHGLADLHGQRVGTLASSQAHEMLRAQPVEVVLYEGVEEPYIDLERGRLAAVLLDNIIAERYGLAHPGLRAVGAVGDGVYAIAVRREHTDLVEALDQALRAMRTDGELQAILSRWHLWDERQAAAAVLPAATAVPPQSLTAAHVLLFLRGAAVTVVISSLAMLLAIAGGLGLSLARRYGARSARIAAQVYVEVFRGTPVLLQLYVLYYGLAPILTLNAFTAAILGLGLNYAAYEAELYRAGLEAVPVGQSEAALALGMSQGLALRRIILPQAIRIALPGMANDFIALLKDSSLVSVITVVELTKQMTITAVDVRGWLIPGLLCAGLYLALSFPLSRLAQRLERRLTPKPR